MSKTLDTPREIRLRRQAKDKGYLLRRSSLVVPTLENMGLYRIVDTEMRTIEAGVRYDLTLDDVAKFLQG